jgi:CDP-diacylglycerol--glycerol-3-phosphate 3-phosphatidyltransferase
MFRHIPNLLTGLRLILAACFFVMLGRYQYHAPHQTAEPIDRSWLNIAFIVYLIALFTDFLDGYLARKWKVEGAFGRVVDPFVDKVLVLGSFVFFAGKNFTIPHYDASELPTDVLTISGVVPWMVVVILARELLVTSLRGLAEASGKAFGAAFIGKAKMVTQSVTILVILVYVNYLRWFTAQGYEEYAKYFRNLCIWVTLAVTVWSCLGYVMKAISIVKKPTAPDLGNQSPSAGTVPRPRHRTESGLTS